MKLKIKSTNNKGIKQLIKRLSGGGSVDVGVLANTGKHDESDDTVAEIAFKHEFGTAFLPERSFIRSTINGKAKEIQAVTRKQYTLVLQNKITTEKGLGIVGAFTAGLIQQTFTNNDWAPNGAGTIARKGSSTPLIDSGQLRQSISWKVNK